MSVPDGVPVGGTEGGISFTTHGNASEDIMGREKIIDLRGKRETQFVFLLITSVFCSPCKHYCE